MRFARAAELRPEQPLWRLRAEICGPVVFEDSREIEEYCERVKSVLERWKAEKGNPNSQIRNLKQIPNPKFEIQNNGPRPDSLPEQARGDCALTPGPSHVDHASEWRYCAWRDRLETYPTGHRGGGRVPWFCPVIPGLRPATAEGTILAALRAVLSRSTTADPHRQSGSAAGRHPRPRRHDGMFLQSMQGVIEKLDGQRFEPVILCSQAIVKTLQTKIRRERLRFVPFGDTLPEAIKQVREAACDLIYYWEVGSDAMNYFLPFARLVPVQCTGWGSTITCGVPRGRLLPFQRTGRMARVRIAVYRTACGSRGRFFAIRTACP